MNFTDLRLRINRFFRNNKIVFFIIILLWLVLFIINSFLKNRPVSTVPETSYTPHTSVMSSSSVVPKLQQENFEDLIAEYVEYCNNSEFVLAFNMISDDCKENVFNNDINRFKSYIYEIMPTAKQHSIQNYSNTMINNVQGYIYQVKYFDDMLATGLTNQEYEYTEEKITFTKDENGETQMAVANFMYEQDVKKITENEYLKIDVIDREVYYSKEEYTVMFTNRTDNYIVIADDTEKNEVNLLLTQEARKRQMVTDIVLAPGATFKTNLSFFRFIDDGDHSLELSFGNIRVMEKYSGTEDVPEEVIKEEKNNAIAKFSATVSL